MAEPFSESSRQKNFAHETESDAACLHPSCPGQLQLQQITNYNRAMAMVTPLDDEVAAAAAQVFDPFVLPTTDAGKEETTNETTLNDEDDFDPFQVGASSANQSKAKARSIIKEKKQSAKGKDSSSVSASASVISRGSTALPPRLVIKFRMHEEVSSSVITEGETEGSSSIFVEGTVLVRKIYRWGNSKS
jgi:hypothetical protein